MGILEKGMPFQTRRRESVQEGGGHEVERVRPAGEVIVLVGVSGSGKSTVGKQLASALGVTFIEGDEYHSPSNIAKMRAGVALGDADRWPWLESLGRDIAAQSARGSSAVVACSALKRAYRDALAKAAGRPLTFLHLIIDPAILAARLNARQQHFMPSTLLRSQLETLEPLGADENGTDIAATGTAPKTVAAIGCWLRDGDNLACRCRFHQ